MPLESLDQPFRNPGQSDLSSHEGASQTCARHVLAAAVNGVENSKLEIVVEPGSEVIGSRQLMIDRAWHSVDDGDLPGRFDANSWISGRLRHVGGSQQCIR